MEGFDIGGPHEKIVDDEPSFIEDRPEFLEWLERVNVTTEDGFESYQGGELSDGVPFEYRDLSFPRKFKNKKPKEDPFFEKEEVGSMKPLELGTYSKEEFILMKQCAEFLFERGYKKNTSAVPPHLANGKSLELEKIRALADEYYNLHNVNPQEFNDMKVMVGDWQKATLVWKKSNIEGVPRWTAMIQGHYFMSDKDPEQFKGKNGEYYFVTRPASLQLKDKTMELQFVDLQMPKGK